MDEKIRRMVFLSGSLFLSVMIIAVVVAIFSAVVYIGGKIDSIQMLLFLFILSVNIVISIGSIEGIMKILPSLINNIQAKRPVVINYAKKVASEGDSIDEKAARELFSETELDIIHLLKSHENRMLQSAMVPLINTSKASVSRALTALENKGIIVRMRKGVTNEIVLDETRFR